MGAKGGGGGSSGGTQTVVQKNELPGWVTDAAQRNLNMAYNVSQDMPGAYSGPRYAGITNGMGANIAALQQNVGGSLPAYSLAQAGAANAMNYQPGYVQSGAYDPAQIGAVPQMEASYLGALPGVNAKMIGGMPQLQADQISPAYLAQANLQQYMNPYTSSVVDYGLKALETQRLQALNGVGDQAARSGAFGGSRQGIMEGVTNAGAAMNAGNLASQLMAQNFAQAQNAAVGDITRNMAAQQANQAANLNAGQTNIQALLQAAMANQNAGLNAELANQRTGLQAQMANQGADMSAQATNLGAFLQAALANQQAGNQAAQYNIGSNLQAQLANQSAGLQGAGLNLSAANQLGALAGQGQESYLSSLRAALAGQGLIQQDQQAQYDAQRQAYTEAQQFPLQQLQVPLMALGMTPYGSTQSTTGPAQPQPSSSGFLQGLGGLASLVGMGGTMFGAGGMFPGALAGLFGSDEREKTDIQKFGKDPETGIDMYAYRYKGDPKTYPKVVGPMAQDIAKKYPDQVHDVGGRLAVNLGFPSMRKAFN